jgi:hypothetical protein
VITEHKYRIEKGKLQDRFLASRAKLQIFGGGFGNGKTAAACIKALRIAIDYPGCSGLIARSTYPKLNDTIRKEFLKWCPKSWIQRMPTKDYNTVILKNGSEINFRYVQQGGKQQDDTTGNLLSATYDFIIVDQMDDPTFSMRDLDDLFGRLRGSTTYRGTDTTMPRSGPRWIILTANPTGNWLYTEIVRPVLRKEKGEHDPLLMVDPDTGECIVEVFTGSTYENALNVPPDFIKTLEVKYRGVMKARFLGGKWGAFEGLVYPSFDEAIHGMAKSEILDYINDVRFVSKGYGAQRKYRWREGYDHGIASPYCYLLGFEDDDMNVFIVDGGYEVQQDIRTIGREIWKSRTALQIDNPNRQFVFADPSIFKRTGGIPQTVADLMYSINHIAMTAANNEISTGIIKASTFLAPMEHHVHPSSKQEGAPHIYFSKSLTWLFDEIAAYRWKKNNHGENTDKPVDRNDHSMDALRYILTDADEPLGVTYNDPVTIPQYMLWHEFDTQQRARNWRYNNGR